MHHRIQAWTHRKWSTFFKIHIGWIGLSTALKICKCHLVPDKVLNRGYTHFLLFFCAKIVRLKRLLLNGRPTCIVWKRENSNHCSANSLEISHHPLNQSHEKLKKRRPFATCTLAVSRRPRFPVLQAVRLFLSINFSFFLHEVFILVPLGYCDYSYDSQSKCTPIRQHGEIMPKPKLHSST